MIPAGAEEAAEAAAATDPLSGELRKLLGADAVPEAGLSRFASDQAEGRGVRAHPTAVALPSTAEQARELVAWCWTHDVPMVPRGGGTGYAGGAVPVEGAVVVGMERLSRVRSLEPGLWRGEVEAGLTTADVRRLARENGLLFPPDPGAAEQSLIGGNIATNAGGPHAFGYGHTGRWVTGLEAVVAPGELIRVGGPVTKDVAGYDLKSLLIGSEGTLGLITAGWLRFVPAPEAALPVCAFLTGPRRGAEAVMAVLESGASVTALEFLDGATLAISGESFPWPVPEDAGFLLIADAHGSAAEAEHVRAEVTEALEPLALQVRAPAAAEVETLWRWRDGVSLAVTAHRGGKLSEDLTVPVERLGEAIEATVAIGRRHRLEPCCWGHAGDGNLHSTVMLDPGDADQLERAHAASGELLQLAVDLGGSISGEHGLGQVRSGELARQWPDAALDLHAGVKRAFDPKNLFNPGKKLARPPTPGNLTPGPDSSAG